MLHATWVPSCRTRVPITFVALNGRHRDMFIWPDECLPAGAILVAGPGITQQGRQFSRENLEKVRRALKCNSHCILELLMGGSALVLLAWPLFC